MGLLNRTPATIRDICSDSRILMDAYRPTFVKSLTMVPIRTESPLGTIGTYRADEHIPTHQELALLSALADMTSVPIENVKLYKRLEKRVRKRTRELETANKELESFYILLSIRAKGATLRYKRF
jgi:GAF domain-containing protein